MNKRKYSQEVLKKAAKIEIRSIPGTISFESEESSFSYKTRMNEFGYEERVKIKNTKIHFITFNQKLRDWTCDCWWYANRTSHNFIKWGYCSHILALLKKYNPNRELEEITKMKPTQNQYMRLISDSFRKDINHVKVHKWPTPHHEIMKSILGKVLTDLEINFITEVYFNKGGRADIMDLKNGHVFEIGSTEDLQDFLENKKSKYPQELEIGFIDANLYKSKSIEEIYQALRKLIQNKLGELDDLFKIGETPKW